MKSKLVVRECARNLRKRGLSYSEILKELPHKVSKSMLSYWTSDIKLTEEQQRRIHLLNPTLNPLLREKVGNFNRKRWASIRQSFQLGGRTEAKKHIFDLHMAGCMLYWAEGSKCRNCLMFTNMDVNMMKLFVRFLRECYDVADNLIVLYINSHYLSDKSEEDIKGYWTNELVLPISSVKQFNIERRVPKHRKKDYGYGICQIRVSDYELVQHIFGSIKEYAGINNEDLWIF